MFQTPSVRTLLRANAAFSAVTGLSAVTATGQIAELMGVLQHRLVSVTGAGLLVFAAVLLITSGAPTARLISAARLISVADALWVVGSVFLLVAADLPGQGSMVLAIIATVVAAFALLQMQAIRTVDETHSQTLEVTR